MKIKKIHIVNFKLFNDFTITFDTKMSILVGNNGCGKSTILEALHMALTGQFRGKPIKGQITEALFNNETVKKYVQQINNNQSIEPPKIIIEVFFDQLPIDKGNNNLENEDSNGFSLCISANVKNEYYREFVQRRPITGLPIEMYECRWQTFARQDCYPNSKFVPAKSAYINADNFKDSKMTIVSFISDVLGEENRNKLVGATRKALANFNEDDVLSGINKIISQEKSLYKVSLNPKDVQNNDWSEFISPKVDDVRVDFCGDGEQRIIKTLLATTSAAKNPNLIILEEEPECHLSFSKMNELIASIKEMGNDSQVILTTHSSYVANKLNLQNLVLIRDGKALPLTNLSDETYRFFATRSNYDTLRMVLAKGTILVEGDSDDLIVEKAYKDLYGHLPIEGGIDIITCALSGKRFLEIAKKLELNVAYVTDNDGKPNEKLKKYSDFLNLENIRVCFPKTVNEANYGPNTSSNTLEPELLKANDLKMLNKVLNKRFQNDNELISYMENHKTDCALSVFNYDNFDKEFKYPNYILDAIAAIKQ